MTQVEDRKERMVGILMNMWHKSDSGGAFITSFTTVTSFMTLLTFVLSSCLTLVLSSGHDLVQFYIHFSPDLELF